MFEQVVAKFVGGPCDGTSIAIMTNVRTYRIPEAVIIGGKFTYRNHDHELRELGNEYVLEWLGYEDANQ